MLFNSYEFIFLFLPVLLLVNFALLRIYGGRSSTLWLLAASFFFYSYWNPKYLWLLLGSIVFNFCLGKVLAKAKWATKANARAERNAEFTLYKAIADKSQGTLQRLLLIVGLLFNLGLLGYYKYANFFLTSTTLIASFEISLENTVLPLGISFFTFQQIAYLVDIYRTESSNISSHAGIEASQTDTYGFLDYALFVSFFPQLIAGPIVHFNEIVGQFRQNSAKRISTGSFLIAGHIFVAGLFKKLVIADTLAEYASPVYSLAQSANSVTFFDAWMGTLAYTLQLYFDFSGYCDMAIGIAAMLGFQLPINFNSPYKADSIQDFWRRWHITLSNFLRDYLYIPLGGNRLGQTRQSVNLVVTMLLGGLWHGAGWTFVFWGGLHGFYLMGHRYWRRWTKSYSFTQSKIYSLTSVLLTFLAVLVSWVFFRADSFQSAIAILYSMVDINNLNLSSQILTGRQYITTSAFILVMLVVTWFLPNTHEIFSQENIQSLSPKRQKQTSAVVWQPTRLWAYASAVCTALCLLSLSQVSEFLYFEF